MRCGPSEVAFSVQSIRSTHTQLMQEAIEGRCYVLHGQLQNRPESSKQLNLLRPIYYKDTNYDHFGKSM